ncbi:M protein, serotype 6-like isoform X4 [Cyclopterus lumpus]|uniref:M protein, serotype 6-like isoform X3 n=1 Tax=Cyclopterus lumpus TaxID=8103 RepID=UPI001486830E|nr:M protein, serotype 6-like isoform X3 [Cyclopterus lumpus]XP_034409155.1 M protein, serotype 6-like isoform X4 [Cyclopterus lumpus]
MNRKPPDEIEEIQEEADYVNEPVRPVYKVAAPPDQRFLFFSQTLPPIAVCWLILVLILGLRIHFTSVISEHATQAEEMYWRERNRDLENQKNTLTMERNNLTVELSNLTTRNQDLENRKNTLTMERNNLKVELSNLTTRNQDLENRKNTLTMERNNLKVELSNLTTRNQDLENQKNTLTQQIQDKSWNVMCLC